MTIFVSVDTETGTMRRYDTRMRGVLSGWCRYVWRDADWPAIRAAGEDRTVVQEFYNRPPHWAHVSADKGAA